MASFRKYIPYSSGRTLYGRLLRVADGAVFWWASGTFETDNGTYEETAHPLSECTIPRQGIYKFERQANDVGNGVFQFIVYEQLGASPDPTDPIISIYDFNVHITKDGILMM